ncbi:uncharacterized protein ISCGN_029426 [Ixodes scapularis]
MELAVGLSLFGECFSSPFFSERSWRVLVCAGSVKASVCGSLSHTFFAHWTTLKLFPRKCRNRPVTERAVKWRERTQRQGPTRAWGAERGTCLQLDSSPGRRSCMPPLRWRHVPKIAAPSSSHLDLRSYKKRQQSWTVFISAAVLSQQASNKQTLTTQVAKLKFAQCRHNQSNKNILSAFPRMALVF